MRPVWHKIKGNRNIALWRSLAETIGHISPLVIVMSVGQRCFTKKFYTTNHTWIIVCFFFFIFFVFWWPPSIPASHQVTAWIDSSSFQDPKLLRQLTVDDWINEWRFSLPQTPSVLLYPVRCVYLQLWLSFAHHGCIISGATFTLWFHLHLLSDCSLCCGRGCKYIIFILFCVSSFILKPMFSPVVICISFSFPVLSWNCVLISEFCFVCIHAFVKI